VSHSVLRHYMARRVVKERSFRRRLIWTQFALEAANLQIAAMASRGRRDRRLAVYRSADNRTVTPAEALEELSLLN
jgi:hypothetical protein